VDFDSAHLIMIVARSNIMSAYALTGFDTKQLVPKRNTAIILFRVKDKSRVSIRVTIN